MILNIRSLSDEYVSASVPALAASANTTARLRGVAQGREMQWWIQLDFETIAGPFEVSDQAVLAAQRIKGNRIVTVCHLEEEPYRPCTTVHRKDLSKESAEALWNLQADGEVVVVPRPLGWLQIYLVSLCKRPTGHTMLARQKEKKAADSSGGSQEVSGSV